MTDHALPDAATAAAVTLEGQANVRPVKDSRTAASPTREGLAPALVRDSTQPLGDQLAALYAERITHRLLAPGARLPSVRDCARQHRVSPSTVVSAYDQLQALGLVEARRQRGFFVRGLPGPGRSAGSTAPGHASAGTADTDPGVALAPPVDATALIRGMFRQPPAAAAASGAGAGAGSSGSARSGGGLRGAAGPNGSGGTGTGTGTGLANVDEQVAFVDRHRLQAGKLHWRDGRGRSVHGCGLIDRPPGSPRPEWTGERS